jgi:hypothetical protein
MPTPEEPHIYNSKRQQVTSPPPEMILHETARSHHSQLCQDLQHETSEAERLGITGTSLYLCDNYTTPLHKDKDKTRGLCSQYFLHADEELKEYAFIYAKYRIYMLPRSNCLW